MSGLSKKTSNGTSPIKFYKKTSTGLIKCPVYRKTTNGMERLDVIDVKIKEKGVDVNE